MPAGLLEDEVDAAFGVDVGELRDRAGEELPGILLVEIGERAGVTLTR